MYVHTILCFIIYNTISIFSLKKFRVILTDVFPPKGFLQQNESSFSYIFLKIYLTRFSWKRSWNYLVKWLFYFFINILKTQLSIFAFRVQFYPKKKFLSSYSNMNQSLVSHKFKVILYIHYLDDIVLLVLFYRQIDNITTLYTITKLGAALRRF